MVGVWDEMGGELRGIGKDRERKSDEVHDWILLDISNYQVGVMCLQMGYAWSP